MGFLAKVLYRHEYRAELVGYFSEILTRDLDPTQKGRVLVNHPAQLSCAKLDVQFEPDFLEILGFVRVVLLVDDATLVLAFFRVYPEIRGAGVENHFELVVRGAERDGSNVLGKRIKQGISRSINTWVFLKL